MKDRQVDQSGQQARIPLLSAALHCVAMTGIVFLRSSFGYLYLRSKSVFLVFSWAFVLFSIYAWYQPGVWRAYGPVCVFGVAAVILYIVHLARAVVAQISKTAAHDQHSGTSHPVRLMRLLGKSPSPEFESKLHLWAEPGFILVAAGVLRFGFGEHHLSKWLFFVSVCLWLKEAINHWFTLRQRKRQEDIFDDAGETVEPSDSAGPHAPPPTATRKPRVNRRREGE